MNSLPFRSGLETQAKCALLVSVLVPLAGASSLHHDLTRADALSLISPAPRATSIDALLPVAADPLDLELGRAARVVDADVDSSRTPLDFVSSTTTSSSEVCIGDVPAPSTLPLTTTLEKVIVASGEIEDAVAEFRALLGNPNNGATPGEQPAGRREVNWDGVPVGLTNNAHFPANFFNANSPRGLQYQPGLRGLEVSDNSFININPAYAGEFRPFSGHKLFSPLGTNESDVLFFVAGTQVQAGVRGFGIVFSDVDKEGTTGIKLLDANDVLIETVIAPARTDRRGLSFVGVVLRNPVITHVHIVAGDARLGGDELDVSQGGQHDLVVMDDFIYGEPMATGN